METGNPGVSEWEPVKEYPPRGLTISSDELKFDFIEEFSRIQEFWEEIFDEVGVKFC